MGKTWKNMEKHGKTTINSMDFNGGFFEPCL